MRPVRRTSAVQVAAVIAVGLIIGAAIPPLAVRWGGNPPQVGWMSAGLLAAAAAVIGYLAWSTWQAVHRQSQRVHVDRGIFLLALAKASVLVGAIAAGGYGGFALSFVDLLQTELGRQRVIRGGAASLAGLAFLVTALLLERACMLPSNHDDDGETDAEASPA